jgi:autotransporter-associated beta strand protein
LPLQNRTGRKAKTRKRLTLPTVTGESRRGVILKIYRKQQQLKYSITMNNSSISGNVRRRTVSGFAELKRIFIVGVITLAAVSGAGAKTDVKWTKNTTITQNATYSVLECDNDITVTVAAGVTLTVDNLKVKDNFIKTGQGKILVRNLTKVGAGTLTFNANNTFTQDMDVADGTVAIGGTAGMLACKVTLHDGGNFRFDRTNDFTYAGTLTSYGNAVSSEVIIRNSGRKMTLTGTISVSGKVRITSGTLTVAPAGSLTGLGGETVSGGARLDLSAGNKNLWALTGESGSEIILGAKIDVMGNITLNSSKLTLTELNNLLTATLGNMIASGTTIVSLPSSITNGSYTVINTRGGINLSNFFIGNGPLNKRWYFSTDTAGKQLILNITNL